MQDRFVRQSDLVPRQRLSETFATVIGTGAIGRQVAIQLASIGTPGIQLVDFDRVEDHNVTTQGFIKADIGQLKVAAVSDSIRKIDPDIEVEPVTGRYTPKLEVNQAVFCCVDSISTRSAIWRSIWSKGCRLWVDGRMLGETMRVLTATSADERSQEKYGESLFAQSEAQQGHCTAHSTIYAASIAAGLMVHQFTRWLRGMPLDASLSLNLLASELNVEEIK